jgi:uncharacterized membrane protein YfcA
MEHWELFIFFFFIALIYSSVGFGGGSSYLAILSLYSFSFITIRSTALLCNILVVSTGMYLFYKHGHFHWKKILPLVIISVPMAFLGGLIQTRSEVFFPVLGLSLILASVLMMFQRRRTWDKENGNRETLKPFMYLKNTAIGGSIGFLSGFVGIGGGVFLSPLLHLWNWDTPKRIAATASVFIFLNSVAGLVGQMSNPQFSIEWGLTGALLVAVFIGGQIGSRLGADTFDQLIVKRLTAVVIFAAGIRILVKFLPL